MEDCLKVELATTLLEEVFQTLAQQVHHHDVIHLAILRLLVTDEMEEGDKGLASKLVNELALPEQHDMALHFHCFFYFGG